MSDCSAQNTADSKGPRQEVSSSLEKSSPHNVDQANHLHSEAISSLQPRMAFVKDRAIFLESKVQEPSGTRIGPTDGNKEITSTIIVRSKASEKELDDTFNKIVRHEQPPLSNAEFNEKFGADPKAMERVAKFAQANHLKVLETDPVSGRVVITGKAKDVKDAFRVKLDDYKDTNGEIVRERSNTISVPAAIADDVKGVFGLDNRIIAHSHIEKQPEQGQFSPRVATGFMPNEIADLYAFPKVSMGAGQSVGIIELGGGLDPKDNQTYYENNKMKTPSIQFVGLDGKQNAPGTPGSDEVVLDSQIIGTIAPDAHQQLIFAPANDQGFIDAVNRAIFPAEGEKQNSVISISWGGRESMWSEQTVKSMSDLFKKAAMKGITVFAASGDAGAGDLNPGQRDDGRLVVDYPAADPLVTGTGGTKLSIDQNGKPDEIAWNEKKDSATGGGISEIFPVPSFQRNVNLPPNGNHDSIVGRGVPDVAGDADSLTGYKIRVGGRDAIFGGTSAVAPLYSALILRANSALGKPLGYMNPFFYEHPQIFRDITVGSNNGYPAGPGWDAATGLGVIKGDEFWNAVKDRAKAQGN